MAIAFAQATIHTRAKGHSAIASAAYRSASKLLDERTGLTHDFTNRHDVIFSEIMLPVGACEKFTQREFFWNQLESAEKRRDSQLCKDIVLALPKELNLVSQIELAKRFANTHFVSNGIPADVSIHDHGDGNPHAHILAPLRRLESLGFSKHKARDLNPSFSYGKVVEEDYLGKQWGDMQDAFFIENNIDLSVDLNHVIPEQHEGRIRGESGHYIKETNELIRNARIELVLENTENLINQLSLNHSVFTRRDIEKLLFKTLNTPELSALHLQSVKKILYHGDVISLGANDSGIESYTTKNQYMAEGVLLNSVEKMQARNGHVFTSDAGILAEQYKLNDEQSEALSYIAKGNDLSILIGRPGVGKSYMLKPLKEYYEANQCRVIGASLSGKVAKSLENETGIKSFTIAALSWRLANQKMILGKNDIIVIDEAGMVDFASLSFLINAANKAEAKVVLVGDPDQLKPIQKGEIFKGIAARTGFFELCKIRRQRDDGDRAASLSLAKGNVKEALSHYEGKGSIHFSATSFDAAEHLVADWKAAIHELHQVKEQVMFAFTRAAVLSLNEQARLALQEKGLVSKAQFEWQGITEKSDCQLGISDRVIVRFSDKALGVNSGDSAEVRALNESSFTLRVNGKIVDVPNLYMSQMSREDSRTIQLSTGERILFRKNDRELGVRNGDMAMIESVNKELMVARLDSGEQVIIPNTYKHIEYGYATTVHKGQGMTVDDSRILVDSKYWDSSLSFVAMTRHRDSLSIYADKLQHPNMDALITTLSRTSTKDNVIDWPLDFAIRAGFDPDKMIGRAINKVAGAGSQIRNKWNYIVNYEAYLKTQDMEARVSARQELRAVAKEVASYLDEKSALNKDVVASRKAAKAACTDKIDLNESHNRRVLQDKRAFELVEAHGKAMGNINSKSLDIEGIKQDACRYERYQAVKSVAEIPIDSQVPAVLVEKSRKVNLSKDGIHIRHLAPIYKKTPDALYQQIERVQKMSSEVH